MGLPAFGGEGGRAVAISPPLNPRQTQSHAQIREANEPTHVQGVRQQQDPVADKPYEPPQVGNQKNLLICLKTHPDNIEGGVATIRRIQKTQNRMECSHRQFPRPASSNNLRAKRIKVFVGDPSTFRTMQPSEQILRPTRPGKPQKFKWKSIQARVPARALWVTSR